MQIFGIKATPQFAKDKTTFQIQHTNEIAKRSDRFDIAQHYFKTFHEQITEARTHRANVIGHDAIDGP